VNDLTLIRSSAEATSVTRYQWSEPQGSPVRVELVDSFRFTTIGVIVNGANGQWYWNRYTSVRQYGVPPISGSAATLDEAKQAIMQGLSDAASG
jgi:hypothetical protein